MPLLVTRTIKRSFVYCTAQLRFVLKFFYLYILEAYTKRIEMLRVLFAERLGSVDEILPNEVFRKCMLHALFADEKR